MSGMEKSDMILTQSDLTRQFRSCGVEEGQALMVHTSMRSLGYVVGGAETLIRSLLEIVGEEGTLMMPSQTWKNLDPTTGVHKEAREEWWPVIRENWPPYDKEVTPAIGMGAAAEMLRKWPGACRSDHPARSVAAVGKQAKYLTEEHDLSVICGENSPVDKLYRLDGYVLLIGVGYDKNTSLHLAEARANFPSKAFTDESSAVWRNGQREWVTYRTQAVNDEDFVRLGQAYDQEMNIPVHRVGNAEVRLLRQRPLIDWTVKWMEKHRR